MLNSPIEDIWPAVNVMARATQDREPAALLDGALVVTDPEAAPSKVAECHAQGEPLIAGVSVYRAAKPRVELHCAEGKRGQEHSRSVEQALQEAGPVGGWSAQGPLPGLAH